ARPDGWCEWLPAPPPPSSPRPALPFRSPHRSQGCSSPAPRPLPPPGRPQFAPAPFHPRGAPARLPPRCGGEAARHCPSSAPGGGCADRKRQRATPAPAMRQTSGSSWSLLLGGGSQPEARAIDELLDAVLAHPHSLVTLQAGQSHVHLVVDHRAATLAVFNRLDLPLQHVIGT